MVVDTQEGRIGSNTAAAAVVVVEEGQGYTGPEKMHLVDQSTLVVEDMAVSKKPQTVYKVLEKMIRNPHLVYCHMGLVEQHTENHSAE